MKVIKKHIIAVCSLFAVLMMCVSAYAGQTLVIGVENKDWAGHYRWKDGELVGVDADIVRAVAKRLDVTIVFEALPWKRANQMAQQSLIDGVLDVASTPLRRENLHLVTPPLSKDAVVFWVKQGSSFSYTGEFRKTFRLGIMFGEDWSNWFDENDGPMVVRFTSEISALRSLEEGRIHAFGNYLLAVQEMLRSYDNAGVIVPSVPMIPTYYYLALSRKGDNEALAKRFGEELSLFFNSPEYEKILKANGVKSVSQAYHPSKIK